jgi:hypothetical protein
MGRWSEAFHAYVQARDTADTADTPQQGSVNTVTSVTLADDHDHEVLPPNSERVSPVSTESRRAERKESTAYGQTALLERAITEGYQQATLRRPPSWADPAGRPVRGCFCSCCKGRRWWVRTGGTKRLALLDLPSASSFAPTRLPGIANVKTGSTNVKSSGSIGNRTTHQRREPGRQRDCRDTQQHSEAKRAVKDLMEHGDIEHNLIFLMDGSPASLNIPSVEHNLGILRIVTTIGSATACAVVETVMLVRNDRGGEHLKGLVVIMSYRHKSGVIKTVSSVPIFCDDNGGVV